MDDAIEVRPRWGRRLAIGLGALLLLLVIVYFVATSAGFLKSVILPRAGKALNAEITVDDASISPFSSVVLKNLRLKTTGSEPLLSAGEVRLRYSLMDIIRGNINVDEASVENPAIQIVTEADGTSNLDPLLKKDKVEKEPSTGTPQLNIKNVALKNGTVRLTTKLKAGGPNITELSGLTVTVDQLKNGAGGKVSIASDLRINNKPPTNVADVLAAKISGGYDFNLSPELAPQSIKGATRVQISQAEGAFKDAAGFATALEAEISPTELKQVALRFEKNGQQLGQLRASGPFDMAKLEGILAVQLLSLDKNVLNIAGAGAGIDFANSTINSTNKVELTQKGTFVAVDGQLSGRQLGMIKEAKPTPPVDMDFAYKVSLNMVSRTAALEKILLSARHKSAEFLTMSVDRPLNLSWGDSTYGLKDSALRLNVTNLNLADWAAVLGTNAPSGMVNVGLRLLAQEDGRKLGVDLNAAVDNLSLNIGTNAIKGAQVTLASKGTVEELKRLNISEYQVTLRSNAIPALSVKGAIRYNLEKSEYGVQVIADGSVPQLLGQFAVPGVKSSFGTIKFNANVTATPSETLMSGLAQLDKFTGAVNDLSFNDYQTTLDYNVELRGSLAQLHRVSLTVNQGFNRGGTVDLNGRVDTEKKSGNVAFKVVELNQVTLGPVLKQALGEKTLVSVTMNSSGSAAFGPGTNEIKADLSITNLLVKDVSGSLPKTPLALGLNVDAAMRGNAVDLRQASLQLTPTERAPNRLDVQASLDLSTNNPAPGKFAVKSPGLDLTPYYDIFAGNSTNAPAQAATTTSANANANQEPEAMQLPIKQLTSTIAIDRLFLREVAISNWQATAVVSNNFVILNPLQMTINGAPVAGTAALNLGVKGYTYDVALKADKMPLEPFANSFGAAGSNYKGLLVADALIQGAGTTGASLKNNLKGHANFAATNLDLQILGKWKMIVTPISFVLNVPELTQTPINWIDAQTDLGGGNIKVKNMTVESEAFLANIQGDIVLNDILTNSTMNLPISISLRRSLAQKAMLAGNTPADAKYAKLPDLFTVKGTLGKPETDYDKLAIAKLGLKAGIGITGNAALGNAKSALEVLTTGSSTNTNVVSKVLNPIGNFGRKLLGGGDKTNAPTTNAPANKP